MEKERIEAFYEKLGAIEPRTFRAYGMLPEREFWEMHKRHFSVMMSTSYSRQHYALIGIAQAASIEYQGMLEEYIHAFYHLLTDCFAPYTTALLPATIEDHRSGLKTMTTPENLQNRLRHFSESLHTVLSQPHEDTALAEQLDPYAHANTGKLLRQVHQSFKDETQKISVVIKNFPEDSSYRDEQGEVFLDARWLIFDVLLMHEVRFAFKNWYIRSSLERFGIFQRWSAATVTAIRRALPEGIEKTSAVLRACLHLLPLSLPESTIHLLVKRFERHWLLLEQEGSVIEDPERFVHQVREQYAGGVLLRDLLVKRANWWQKQELELEVTSLTLDGLRRYIKKQRQNIQAFFKANDKTLHEPTEEEKEHMTEFAKSNHTNKYTSYLGRESFFFPTPEKIAEKIMPYFLEELLPWKFQRFSNSNEDFLQNADMFFTLLDNNQEFAVDLFVRKSKDRVSFNTSYKRKCFNARMRTITENKPHIVVPLELSSVLFGMMRAMIHDIEDTSRFNPTIDTYRAIARKIVRFARSDISISRRLDSAAIDLARIIQAEIAHAQKCLPADLATRAVSGTMPSDSDESTPA